MSDLIGFLDRGGPAMVAIAALSVATLALIFWKLWQFLRLGVWGGAPVEAALAAWRQGDRDAAHRALASGKGLRVAVLAAAMAAAQRLPGPAAREETERHARRALAETRQGLRALELIAAIAPLLGLLGTVLGMIGAFQALQATGNRADPAVLAGGIWEALLTTAAGMAVAIPASAALTWFEAVADGLQADLEDAATQVLLATEGET